MEITKTVKVLNRLGLHIRAAATFVKATSQYKCRILIRRNSGSLNAKSLINLMTLAAGYGQELTLVFEGDDASEASMAIQALFLNKFGERD